MPKEKRLVLPLGEFCETVYKVNVDDVMDRLSVVDIDTSWIRAEKCQVDDAREELGELVKDFDDEDLKEAIERTMARAYESSIIDDYYRLINEGLEEKIKQDFENLNEFFNAQEEINPDGELNVIRIDWSNDEIEFEGVLRKFEAYIVNCINGYGMFHYDSLSEFEYVCGDDQEYRIKSHLHWLKHLEEIYGSVYNFFRFSLDYIEPYGDTDYSMDDLKEEIEEILFFRKEA